MTTRPLRVLLLICCVAASSVAAASSTLDRIRETGTITFAYRDHAAPFSYTDRDGRVRGYSTELCNAVAASIQQSLKLSTLKIVWQPVDAAARLDAVASGRVDAECGTTTITLSRMKDVDFSLPIFVDGGSVLVRAKSRIAKLADLRGRKIAVIAGTTTEQSLVSAFGVLGGQATLVPVTNAAEGAAMLAAGKVDGYAGDRIVLTDIKLHSPQGRDYALLGADFSYEPYAIVVRRDDPDFRLAVNRALVGLYKGGGIDPIFQRWLAPLGPPGPLLHSMYYLSSLPD
ncbi:MAG TPA: amino acid ABC transporter substrate-binding protein [Casimicrobiaceae bacterium]|jgi:ABC-type amino acid transport substrate-binding protein